MSIEDEARKALAVREQERARQDLASRAASAAAKKRPNEQVKTAIEQWTAALGFSSVEITAWENSFWDNKGAAGVTVFAAFTADGYQFLARQIEGQPFQVFLRSPKVQPRNEYARNSWPFQELLIPGKAKRTTEVVYLIKDLADLGAALKLH